MLELQHVVKSFTSKVNAVDDVSLTLSRGVVGLIGQNGAGKTTLMQMMATLTRPTSGRILFQGVDIVEKPDAIRSRLGFLPQDFGVYPNLTAMEFMQYFAALKGVRSQARIRELLELVNLHQFADRPASTFSGGMRRRLGIAQALLNDPELLIVDEPTAGLDPEERQRFRNLMAEIGTEKLVILSTHIVSDIESIGSLYAIMHKGKLLSAQTPEAIVNGVRNIIWSVQVDGPEHDMLKHKVHILHAERRGAAVNLRIVHPECPCAGAVLVEPSLEEALIAQRFATPALPADLGQMVAA